MARCWRPLASSGSMDSPRTRSGFKPSDFCAKASSTCLNRAKACCAISGLIAARLRIKAFWSSGQWCSGSMAGFAAAGSATPSGAALSFGLVEDVANLPDASRAGPAPAFAGASFAGSDAGEAAFAEGSGDGAAGWAASGDCAAGVAASKAAVKSDRMSSPPLVSVVMKMPLLRTPFVANFHHVVALQEFPVSCPAGYCFSVDDVSVFRDVSHHHRRRGYYLFCSGSARAQRRIIAIFNGSKLVALGLARVAKVGV